MENIIHKGVVKSVSDKGVTVEIVTKSACAQCHARMMCAVSDMRVKEINVSRPLNQEFAVGEEVNVVMRHSMGMRAVWISYIIPLIILMVLLLSLLLIFENELVAGLSAIGGIALYYFVIYLFRNKLNRRFTFSIEKL